MRTYPALILASSMAVGMAAMAPAHARNVEQSKTVGPYRVELQILPPEPFYTRAVANSQHPADGMLFIGGAVPVQPDSAAHPNHHLIVQVFDRKTGTAVTNARVTLMYEELGDRGRPVGMAVTVPVATMQAIGRGPKSTHYGNNVVIGPGTFRVVVVVDGLQTAFTVKV